jgi:hypothetical protein
MCLLIVVPFNQVGSSSSGCVRSPNECEIGEAAIPYRLIVSSVVIWMGLLWIQPHKVNTNALIDSSSSGDNDGDMFRKIVSSFLFVH